MTAAFRNVLQWVYHAKRLIVREGEEEEKWYLWESALAVVC